MITKERLIEEIGLRLQRLPDGEMKDRAIEAHERYNAYGWVNTVIGVDLLHLAERIEQGYAMKYAFNWRENGTFDEWFEYSEKHRDLLSGKIEEQPQEETKKSTPTYGEYGEMPLGTTSEDGEFSVFKLTYKNHCKYQIVHNNAAQKMTRFESGMGIQEFKFPNKYFPQISEMLKEVL